MTFAWARPGRRGPGALAGTLRRRGVRRIVWFHCEHFAPWRVEPERDLIDVAEADAVGVRRFAAALTAAPAMWKATLFYQPHLVHALAKPGRELDRAATGDAVGFLRPDPTAAAIRAAAIREVAAAGVDIQLRIDHRRYVWTPILADDLLSERLARPEVRAHDAARFGLALRLSLATFRRETGRALLPWMFAHADHALAKSDANRCTLSAELPILTSHGCVADFSLPGPGATGAPFFAEPFLARPIDGARSWERTEAEPERAWMNGWSAAEKLFVWSAPTPALDLGGIRPQEASAAAEMAIGGGVVCGETLWLKTEALTTRIAEGWQPSSERPGARQMLDLIREAARRADAEFTPASASDVYRDFIADATATAESPALTASSRAIDPPPTDGPRRRDQINLLAIDEVFASITALGLKESGATEFYQGRAEKGQMLVPYEKLIADALLGRRPQLAHVYEAGCGAGVFTLLMAANGIAATGIDRHAHRTALADRVRDRVVAAGGPLAAPCLFKRARLPQALRRIEGRNGALVFTNVIGALSEKEEDQLIKLALRFRVTILDLARFFRRREGAEQQALLDKLAAAGFPPPLRLAGFPSFRVYLRDREDW